VPTLQFLGSWRAAWACLADGFLCLYEVVRNERQPLSDKD
jgi:hypothetical protein